MRTTSLNSFAKITAIAVAGMLSTANLANAADNNWDKNWIAVTVGNGAAWGLATSRSRSTAIASAIADCRTRSTVAGSGCGARTSTVRSGWTLAYACGTTSFIVTADTLADARAAAINRDIDLREIRRLALPVCDLVVAVGPAGRPATSNELSELAASEIIP
jgi:hypothetical protein